MSKHLDSHLIRSFLQACFPEATMFKYDWAILVLFLQDLYRLGARRIGVLGLPPLGCVPSQRTLKGGLERNCVENYNEMSELFNSKLSAEIDNLNNKYPEARIVYGDIYYSLLDITHSPQKYGMQCSSNFNSFILETKICLKILIPAFFYCSETDRIPVYEHWMLWHRKNRGSRDLQMCMSRCI